MKVGRKQKFLFLIILLIIFIEITITSKITSATSCKTNTECYPGYCYRGSCVNTCGNGGCQANHGETSSTCCQDCGCPSGEKCALNSGSYSCVASFSANGVCKYGSGERIGVNFVNNKDDCDQDNDGKYDSCKSDGTCIDYWNGNTPVGVKNENGVRLLQARIDFCPDTNIDYDNYVSNLHFGSTIVDYKNYYDDQGCSCQQKQNNQYTGVNKCSSVTYDCTSIYDDECIKPNSVSMTCTFEHAQCFMKNREQFMEHQSVQDGDFPALPSPDLPVIIQHSSFNIRRRSRRHQSRAAQPPVTLQSPFNIQHSTFLSVAGPGRERAQDVTAHQPGGRGRTAVGQMAALAAGTPEEWYVGT